MDAHVSWSAVLQMIDESEMAEDKSILTAAGTNNSLAAAGEENSWWLLLGSSNLIDSCWGGKTENLQLGGKYLWRLHWGTQDLLSQNSVGRRFISLAPLGILKLKLWGELNSWGSSGWGIVKISYCWGTLMNSAGDRKNFSERNLPWQ